MTHGLFHGVPLPLVLSVTLAVFLLATAAGYRVGAWVNARRPTGSTSDLGTTLGGLLGLLGLMLAFTFSMAGERYERRRALVVDDANAIGTAWLRADLVPEPGRSRARALLLAYGRERHAIGVGQGAADPTEALARMDRLHQELWNVAAEAARAQPTPPSALFVAAVNEVIDVHGLRVALGMRNPVPPVILVTLHLVTIIVLVAMGYGRGLTGDRSGVAPTVLATVLAVVLALILDLGRPTEGFLTTSQQSMAEVVQMMETAGKP